MISGSYSFHFLKSFPTNTQNIVRYWEIAISITVQNFCVLLDDLFFKAFWTFFPFLSRMHKGRSYYTFLPQVSVLVQYRLWYTVLYINTFFHFMNLKALVRRCTFVAFWGIYTSAVFLDNGDTDAAITMGMVLLNEAATSKGDVGKRRSKLFSTTKTMFRQLEDSDKLQMNLWLSFQKVSTLNEFLPFVGWRRGEYKNSVDKTAFTWSCNSKKKTFKHTQLRYSLTQYLHNVVLHKCFLALVLEVSDIKNKSFKTLFSKWI